MDIDGSLNETRRRGAPWREKRGAYRDHQAVSAIENLEDAQAKAQDAVPYTSWPQLSQARVQSVPSATADPKGQDAPPRGKKSYQETREKLVSLNREARSSADAKESARRAEMAERRRRERGGANRPEANRTGERRFQRSAQQPTQRRADGHEREVQMQRIHKGQRRNIFAKLAARLRRQKVDEERASLSVLDRLQQMRLARQQRREQAELTQAYRERLEKLERRRHEQQARQAKPRRDKPEAGREAPPDHSRQALEQRLQRRADEKHREARARLLKRYQEERARLAERHRARQVRVGSGPSQPGGRLQASVKRLRQTRERRVQRYRLRLRRIRLRRLERVRRTQSERQIRQREQTRRDERSSRREPSGLAARRERDRRHAERQYRERQDSVRAHERRERRNREQERRRQRRRGGW